MSASVAELVEAVETGDLGRARLLLHERPVLAVTDLSGNDERRALHFAVWRRDRAMVELLMGSGADARQGIYPHRDATSALVMARERGYDDIAVAIEEEERARRAEMSCPNVTVSPVHEQIQAAIARSDNATAIRLLESDGSLIGACDRTGGTPLHAAAEAGNEEMVEWLLGKRADARKEDANGLTALDRAAWAADPGEENARRFRDIAERLLKRGAAETIFGAVALGNAGRIRELVAADPGLLRGIGRRGGLLSLAVRHGQIETVKLLLDLGADVDERVYLTELEHPTLSWGLPLWLAALGNKREIAKELLDRGADPNANVYASGWPLRNAWGHEDGAVKQMLLERGAKLQPYMVAESHDVEAAKRMLEADAGDEVARELGWSAADHGCPAILTLALGRIQLAGDDPGWHWFLIQPIRGAEGGGSEIEDHFECMKLLLEHGANANVSRLGQTALHFVAGRHGSLNDDARARFANLLLDHGARLDVRDELLRSTPLGWACRWGRTGLVKALLVRGASVEEQDAEAWATPITWAEKMGHKGVVAVLRKEMPGVHS